MNSSATYVLGIILELIFVVWVSMTLHSHANAIEALQNENMHLREDVRQAADQSARIQLLELKIQEMKWEVED